MRDEDQNPYSAPSASELPVSAALAEQQTLGEILKAWLKLAVPYNSVLIADVVVLTFGFSPQNVPDEEYWTRIVVCAFIANACYLLGPTIECCATRMGIWHRACRIILFVAGLALATLLASFYVLAYGTFWELAF